MAGAKKGDKAAAGAAPAAPKAPAPRKRAAAANGVTPRAQQPEEVIPFAWAGNPYKLKSATDHVSETQPGLKGKEKEAAIRERYVLLRGGIVGEEKKVAARGKGKVVNLADDDGSEDIENDGDDEPEGDE